MSEMAYCRDVARKVELERDISDLKTKMGNLAEQISFKADPRLARRDPRALDAGGLAVAAFELAQLQERWLAADDELTAICRVLGR